MKKPLYVGICGRMGAGKDTVAGLIKSQCENLGLSVAVARFADPIKKAASMWFDISDEILQDTELKNTTLIPLHTVDTSISVRELLQGVGSSMRSIHTNFWVELFHRMYGPDRWGGGDDDDDGSSWVVIVPDLRYTNEEDYLKQQDGMVVKVLREVYPEMTPGRIHDHASETSYQDIREDCLIHNNSTIQDLVPQISVLVRTMKRRLDYVRS